MKAPAHRLCPSEKSMQLRRLVSVPVVAGLLAVTIPATAAHAAEPRLTAEDEAQCMKGDIEQREKCREALRAKKKKEAQDKEKDRADSVDKTPPTAPAP